MQVRGKEDYVPAEYSRGYSEDVDVIREREFPLLKGGLAILYYELRIQSTSANSILQIPHTWTMQVLLCMPAH